MICVVIPEHKQGSLWSKYCQNQIVFKKKVTNCLLKVNHRGTFEKQITSYSKKNVIENIVLKGV